MSTIAIQYALVVCVMLIGRAVADEISLGREFGVGIIQGRVFSFGKNVYGQLGIGSVDSNSFSSEVHLVEKFGTGDIVSVCAGYSHAAAIDSDGAIFTWGYGINGQLGHARRQNEHSPTLLHSSEGILSVSCGDLNTFVVGSGGHLFGFGWNYFKQIRASQEVNELTPILISVDSKTVVAVSSGHAHVCAITDDQLLYCWGSNDEAQLGAEVQGRSGIPPTRVSDVSGSSNRYLEIGCGEYYSCGADTQGNILCFGMFGGGDAVRSPTQIVETGSLYGEEILGISIGWEHSCVFGDAHAWCFGRVGSRWIAQDPGALPASGAANVPMQMKTEGINGIQEIAIGINRTCVKDSDALLCYGADQMTVSDGYEVLDFSGLELPRQIESSTLLSTTTSTVLKITSTSTSTSTRSTATTSRSSEHRVVTSLLKGPPMPPEDQIGITTDENASQNDVAPGSSQAEEDGNVYIILGATGAGLVCAICSVVAVFTICNASKSKRRAVRNAGGMASSPHKQMRGNAHSDSSRSGRSKSVSRSTSRGNLGATGGAHARRRSVKLNQHVSGNSSAEYGQIQLSLTPSNEYATFVPTTDQSGYQRGDLHISAVNEYSSISHPTTTDEYVTGDIENVS